MEANNIPRQLTYKERMEIKRFVVDMCDNYDSEYGCLPLDSSCYMLSKRWTGAYCKYFSNAVLPMRPDLESSLNKGNTVNMKPCSVCGVPFTALGRKTYCSDACRVKGSHGKERQKKKKQRGNKVCGFPI